MEIEINKVVAVYTGGSIWLFYGQFDDGNYFLTDDYGNTIILNKDPSDFDESLFKEWQEEHKIKNLEGDERNTFLENLLSRLRNPRLLDELNGFSKTDCVVYEECFFDKEIKNED